MKPPASTPRQVKFQTFLRSVQVSKTFERTYIFILLPNSKQYEIANLQIGSNMKRQVRFEQVLISCESNVWSFKRKEMRIVSAAQMVSSCAAAQVMLPACRSSVGKWPVGPR